jgi:4-amino-4-deoxy-L-arabinose transferase-like glycosyltransferase
MPSSAPLKPLMAATAHANDRSSTTHAAVIFILLLLFALASRFPFFFRDVISWDESTFILMGQAILDGHLPYVTLFDVKPPLLFAFFAAVIWIGGKSILAIRLAGMLCVWVVACFTYQSARQLWNARAGAIAGLLYVVASAVIAHGNGQATMSETVALVPLVGSLLVLWRTSSTPWRFFLAGALIAVAAMVRSNLIVVAFAVGIWVLWSQRKLPLREIAGAVLAYCIGGGLVVLLIFLPYYAAHQGSLFWDAVFVAPTLYSSGQLGPAAVIVRQVKNALGIFPGPWFPNSENLLGLGIWLPAVIGLALTLNRRSRSLGPPGDGHWLVCTYTLAVGVSIAVGGAAYPHYLIQLLPFMCVYAAQVYARLIDYPVRRRFSLPLAATLLLLALLPVARQYSIIVARLRSGAPLAYGQSYDIARKLRPACANGCSLYLLNDQLVYWFLNVTPPSRLAVHPANVVMEYAIRAADGPTATPESEIRQILNSAPDYIVKPDVIWYFDASPALDLLESTVKSQYRALAAAGDQTIYQRMRSTPK